MIDRQGQQASPAGAGPSGGKQQQGDRIAAAAERYGQRMVDVVFEPRIQAGSGAGLEVAGQLQAARVRTWPARVRTATLAPSA